MHICHQEVYAVCLLIASLANCGVAFKISGWYDHFKCKLIARFK